MWNFNQTAKLLITGVHLADTFTYPIKLSEMIHGFGYPLSNRIPGRARRALVRVATRCGVCRALSAGPVGLSVTPSLEHHSPRQRDRQTDRQTMVYLVQTQYRSPSYQACISSLSQSRSRSR